MNIGQCDTDIVQMRQPGRGVEFEYQGAGIAVNDQPRQAIVFAVDKAVAGGTLGQQGRAQLRGGTQFVFEPVPVNGGRLIVLQNAHADWGVGIEQTYGQKAAFAVENNGQVAGCALVTLLANGLVKKPGVSLTQGAFCFWRNTERKALLGRWGDM